MKLEKILIRNFRSVGENGLELTFVSTRTTFIGENNVGKSSIFEAIKRVLEPEVVWNVEDWYAGDQNKTIEIQLECILDSNQIKQIIEILKLPVKLEDFRVSFNNKLTYGFRKALGQSSYFLKLGEINIQNDSGWIGEIDQNSSYTPVSWQEIIIEIKHQKSKNLIQIIKEILDKKKQSSIPTRIDFGFNILDYLIRLIKPSVIVIEEFREKPQEMLNNFLISPNGRDLASVLFNLKNEKREQREKFYQIREKFHQLFPTLEFEVTKAGKILIQKAGIELESTTFYIGAGILESLLLITHLIAHSDKVLCVDHPELHLHPHAQRRLDVFIEEASESQILSITHSPYFVNLNKSSSILRFVQKDTQTEVIEPSQNYFTDEDFFRLEQILDIDSKELFFARKVVLVEGQTELGALPIFASDIYNFDENGVSIIFVGGKKSFEIFVKLCEGFKIPYLVIADNDAKKEVLKLKEKYPSCNSHLLPDKFDELLPGKLRKEAESILGTGSKPRVGRYAAKKLIERGEIPDEIRLIIEQVKNL